MGRPKLVKKFHKVVDLNQGKMEATGHYRNTYLSHKNHQRTKMILPSPETRPQYSPMTVLPTTKEAFINHGIPIKRKLIIPKEELKVKNGKLDDMTMYKQDFPSKLQLPPLVVVKREERVKSSGLFDGRTINKDHYKDWKIGPRPRYMELKSLSGPLIFPRKKNLQISDIEKLYKSTTHSNYTKVPTDQLTRSEIKIHPDNIRVGEGDIDLKTTTNLTYKANPIGDRILVKTQEKKINYPIPPKMICDTKYNSDFKTTNFIAPPKLASPAPATIQLKMDKQCDYETEQRKQFHGWDIKKHPRIKANKLEDHTEVSTDKMQAITTSMQDYPAKSAEAIVSIRRPCTNQSIKQTKVDYTTSNKASYKEWKDAIKKRTRFGDFHEAFKQSIIPSTRKTNYQTTNQSEFIEKKGHVRKSMKPIHKMLVDEKLNHDFNTTSRLCFQHPPASCYEIEEIVVAC